MVAAKLDEELPAGTQVNVKGTFHGSVFRGKNLRMRLDTSDDYENGPWSPVADWITLAINAGDPSQLEAHQRADGRLHILYTDAYANPSPPGRRVVSVYGRNGGKLLCARTGGSHSLSLAPAIDLAERVIVSDDRGLETLSSPRPPVSIGGCNTYFGEIHWHSEYSGDGYRPLSDCLAYARDDLGLDFASPGDHTPNKMLDYFDVCDEFNDPGKFATLLGHEFNAWKGHLNFYYRDRAAAAKLDECRAVYFADPRSKAPDRLWLEPFYAGFDPEEIVMIPHHMNITSGTVAGVLTPQGIPAWQEFDWRAVDDRYVRVAEIIQMRGSYETEEIDERWRMISGGYGCSVRTALAMGHRFGLIGGTDNHDGWPVRYSGGVNSHLKFFSNYVGLAAIQAPELTREAIFAALRARRTYATSGARIVVDFTLNGEYPMGSEAKLVPLTPREFHILVKGTAPLEQVEVISQGTTLASIPVSGDTDMDVEWTDPRRDAPNDNCYYYLRVRQSDGHCAWGSPIWVDYAGS